MNDSTSPTADITVVHRSVPGPNSSDPRDRQVFRRLLDLVALGLTVRVVPAEPHLPGGAPRTLAAAGVEVVAGRRVPVSAALGRLASTTRCWYLTDSCPTEAVLGTLESLDGPLVVDLDHLRSDELITGADALRPTEVDGLATEIDHVKEFERRLLERADAVLCNAAHTAASVASLLGDRAADTLVQVVAPTAPATGGSADGTGSRRLVLAGRFSDEFATPDETIARRLLDDDTMPGARLAIVGEDTVPLLRHGFSAGFDIVSRRDARDVICSAAGVLDVRTHGVATTARRAELVAAGVPFVASTTALGGTELPDAAKELRCDDPAEQIELLLRLRDDERFATDVREALRELAAGTDPLVTRAQLSDALEALGLCAAGSAGPGPVADGLTPAYTTDEYLETDTGGTLAAADPRVAELEQTMVPLRLLSRDDSINLQSTMDADQRYRVFSRTHLAAGPAIEPPTTPGADQVGFSILVPTWNTDPELLEECIDSVLAQTHQNWELCIVDDGSTESAHLDVLRQAAASDDRVRVAENQWNQGIALATNDAFAMSRNDWVVLLDHDDVLKPDALAWVAAYVTRCPDYDIWYSDEDKIGLDGRLVMPFFKPDWSPDLLDGVNYVCHLLCIRRTLMDQVGGFRSGFDGAQDFDLVLRLTEQARRVGHISKPLYSWRMVEGSTALDTGSKPKAHHAGHQALVDALERRFVPGVVEDGAADTTHVVRYSVDTEQLLTIMIPTRDRVDLLRACVERLECATGGVRYELLIVDNHSSDPDTLTYLDHLITQGHQVVRYPHEFSFARQIDLGALHARGDLLLILNNDALARNNDWLIRMMEQAQRPEVGLVGARLMFPEDQRDGRPQHEGIVMGMAGLAYNIDLGGYMGLDQFVRNCSSVTAACVMLRTSVLRAVAGMEERLRVAYNDVDFGLRISELGYRVVYTPHAVLEHPESASRGSLHPTEDEEWLMERWGLKGDLREPFVNPHFEWLMPVFYRL